MLRKRVSFIVSVFLYGTLGCLMNTASGIASDNKPPGDVSGFNATIEKKYVKLSWTNPGDSDFSGTMIRYRTDGKYPKDFRDGTFVCNRPGLPTERDKCELSLAGSNSKKTYYFSAFTYDTLGNYSHTAHATATPSEALDNNFDENNERRNSGGGGGCFISAVMP